MPISASSAYSGDRYKVAAPITGADSPNSASTNFTFSWTLRYAFYKNNAEAGPREAPFSLDRPPLTINVSGANTVATAENPFAKYHAIRSMIERQNASPSRAASKIACASIASGEYLLSQKRLCAAGNTMPEQLYQSKSGSMRLQAPFVPASTDQIVALNMQMADFPSRMIMPAVKFPVDNNSAGYTTANRRTNHIFRPASCAEQELTPGKLLRCPESDVREGRYDLEHRRNREINPLQIRRVFDDAKLVANRSRQPHPNIMERRWSKQNTKMVH